MRNGTQLVSVAISSLLIFASCHADNEKPVILTMAGNIKIDGKSTEPNTNLFGPLENLFLTDLVEFDARTYQYHSLMVKEIIGSEGGKVWDVKILDGVKFHDGMPLTAEDVVSSIDKNREFDPSLKSIILAETRDKTTIRLTFADQVSDIWDTLNNIYIYPGHIFKNVESWRDTFLKNPVGSGPFKFERWIDRGVIFAANKGYFEGAPKIDLIVYRFEGDENIRLASLLKGDVDIISPVSPRVADFIERDRRFYLSRSTFPYYSALFLNNGSFIFKDVRIRRAVNMALNRDILIEKTAKSAAIPVYSPFDKGMLPEDYHFVPNRYAPKTAASILAEAGWKPNIYGICEKDGKRLIVKLFFWEGSDEFRAAADEIGRQLYEVGIGIEQHPVSYTDIDNPNILSLQYDVLLASKSTYYPEIAWQSKKIYGTSTRNYSDYSNKEVDALFEEIKMGSHDDNKRRFASIDRIIHEDVPVVLLYTPVYYTAANRRFSEAKDFNASPFDIYKIKDWSPQERRHVDNTQHAGGMPDKVRHFTHQTK